MKRSDSGRPKPRNVRVAWDESNLEFLDATKSPKQKITEPKTPYHVPAQEEGAISPIAGEGKKFLDQAVQADEIQHALMEVASTSSSQRKSRGGWTSSEDEGDDMEQDSQGGESSSHDKSFREQRKAHYDEFRKVKSLRHAAAPAMEDEDAQPVEKEDALSPADAQGVKDMDGSTSAANVQGVKDTDGSAVSR